MMPSRAAIPAGYRGDARAAIFVVAFLGEVFQGKLRSNTGQWMIIAREMAGVHCCTR